ncbi:MAG: hypothetical protein CSA36_02120 [Draconibacterium sp.]|nr:MAG: hypothetical protein CSA36_02120 [Draconibacterium sp.]
MNKFLKSWQLIAFSVVMFGAVSCDKDEPQTPQGGKGIVLVETTVKNADGKSGSSYFQLVSELKGNINNSEAIQVGFNVPFSVWGNDIFVFPAFEFGTTGITELRKYTYKKNDYLEKPQVLEIPTGMGVFNSTKINDTKMYVPSYSVGKILIVNPKTMTKTGEIDITSYAHGDNNPESGYGFVRDGLYYLPLGQAGANWMPHPDHLQVDVLVIDTETDEVTKMISETETGLCFPTRPMLKDMIFTDENKDLYIACVGFFGFNPEYLKSGFVCIPNGQTEFDTLKSWDVSNTPIEGTSYKPASIVNTLYVGDGKVVAFASILELSTDPYTSKNNMAVLIDLEEKTIKKIEGLPLTDGHSVLLEEHNGKVILGIYGKDKAGFFTYDPATEEVTHDATTVGNPTFVHFFE